MEYEFGTGWNPDLEALHSNFDEWASGQVACTVGDDELPQSCDEAFGVLPVNNQKRFNSCSGNMIDKIVEYDEWINTGHVINLSARFSYLAARMMDGSNNGPDAGASIRGAVKATQMYGVVTESDFPYWGDRESFNPDVPEHIITLARDHKIRSSTPIQSSDALIRFLGTRQGGVAFGVPWTDGLINYRGGAPITVDVARSGRLRGYHALCSLTYVWFNGRRVPRLWNSHTTGWGDHGTALFEPEVFDYWLRNTVFGSFGMSQLETFTKRELQSWHGAFSGGVG